MARLLGVDRRRFYEWGAARQAPPTPRVARMNRLDRPGHGVPRGLGRDVRVPPVLGGSGQGRLGRVPQDSRESHAARRYPGDLPAHVASGHDGARPGPLRHPRSGALPFRHGRERHGLVLRHHQPVLRGQLPEHVIFHADRGSQYTSRQIAELASELHLLQSVGGTGICYDNAATESLWSTFKNQYYFRHVFTTLDELRRATHAWIDSWYNAHRRHSAIGNLSPQDYERRLETQAGK